MRLIVLQGKSERRARNVRKSSCFVGDKLLKMQDDRILLQQTKLIIQQTKRKASHTLITHRLEREDLRKTPLNTQTQKCDRPRMRDFGRPRELPLGSKIDGQFPTFPPQHADTSPPHPQQSYQKQRTRASYSHPAYSHHAHLL